MWRLVRRCLSWVTQPQKALRRTAIKLVRRLKSPAMVWGYRDAGGEWRPRTRMSDTVFINHRENIHVADNIFVWHYTILDGTGGLEIGEGTQIGAWVGIFTHSSHIAIRLLGDHYQEIPEYEKPAFSITRTKIGRYVFIGAAAKILPGVTIGDGALVSSGAVVSRDVEAFAVVSGNPAKTVGDVRKIDQEHLCDPKIREWYDEWQVKI